MPRQIKTTTRHKLACHASALGRSSHAAMVLRAYDDARDAGEHVRIEVGFAGFRLRDVHSGTVIFD